MVETKKHTLIDVIVYDENNKLLPLQKMIYENVYFIIRQENHVIATKKKLTYSILNMDIPYYHRCNIGVEFS